MFYSLLFGSAITHRLELPEIMRQFDKDFLSALQDVRVSKCSNETQNFLNMLMRNHNSCESLLELSEPEFVFDAVHANETGRMNWPGSPVLHLR